MATTRRAEASSSRPRPRPTPQGSATAPEAPAAASHTGPDAPPGNGSRPHQPRTAPTRGRNRRKAGREIVRPDPTQSGQVVAAAGSAIVTAARVGRLLGRSGWRIAKQLPGVDVVEQQAQKIRHAASAEVFRLLEVPQQVFGTPGNPGSPASPEEQRVMMLVQDADTDPAPLRTAMTELLERSSEADDAQSRDYLFGTIVSQLVPDEARILAALGDGRTFAVVDVVSKQVGRATTRTVLSNASTIGNAAGVSLPQNVGTYLTRLHGYGLVQFGSPDKSLDGQFDLLSGEASVLAAKAAIDSGKQGSSKVQRKAVSLSPLGAEFWAACAPSRSQLEQRRS